MRLPSKSPSSPASQQRSAVASPRNQARQSRRMTVLFFDPQQLLQNVKDGSSRRGSKESRPEQLDDDLDAEQKDKTHKTYPKTPKPKAISGNPLISGVSAEVKSTSRRSSDSSGEFINVAIRIRPMLAQNKGERDILHVDHAENQITIDTSSWTKQNETQQAKRTFKYDFVFDSRENQGGNMASQDTIYEFFGDRVVTSAFDGYNACLFAYGQTGTGKTHTVMGHPGRREERGLLPRILESLFAEVENRRSQANIGKVPSPSSASGSGGGDPFSVRISYLEVFNEQLHDLLVPPKSNAPRDALQVRYHPKFGVVINDLTEAVAPSIAEALELLHFGTRMRSIASTSMNSRSSRAHTVFTFRFEQTSRESGDSQIAQVQLIDLAGREQEKSSSDNRERLRERQFINTSLFHLSTCILNLSRGAKGKFQHEWAFRNSRLTLLLAHSLSGNSRTGMIGAVSPAASDTDETLSTLRFADAVKKIRTTVSCNRVNKTNVVKELTEQIEKLKREMQQKQRAESSELQDQVQQLEAVCAHYAERLEQEQNNSKALAAERAACLKDLGLSIGAEGVSLQVGEEQGVPYLVNLSEDPYLAGCLMYFLKGPEEVTLGSAEGNTIRLKGLGIEPRHCVIENEGNQNLFLRVIDTGKDIPRAFLNGRRVDAHGQEMKHSDRLVLGHSCAFRVVVPLNARAHRERMASSMDKADLEQALAEIEDSGSRTFQHLRKYVEDIEQNVGADTAGAFVRQVHRSVPLVDEANQITREIRQAELTFTLQVLTDLWSPLTNMPELVVTVLSNMRTDRPSDSPRRSTRNIREASGHHHPPVRQPGAQADSRGQRGIERTSSQGLWQDGDQGFGTLKFVWSFEKFEGRLQSMRDIYEEMQRHGLAYVQRRLDAEPYIDPWKEISAGEVQVLIDGVNSGACHSSSGLLRRASAGSAISGVGSTASRPTDMGVTLGSLGRRHSTFDGRWTDEDRPGEAVTVIRGEDLHWNDGDVAKINMIGKDSFSITSKGEVYTAHLQADGRLKWDFGGVWIREPVLGDRVASSATSISFGSKKALATPPLGTRGVCSPSQTTRQTSWSPPQGTRSHRASIRLDSDVFDNGAEGGDFEGLEMGRPSSKLSQWYNIGRRASRVHASQQVLQDQLLDLQKRAQQDQRSLGVSSNCGASPGLESRNLGSPRGLGLESLDEPTSSSESSSSSSGAIKAKRDRSRRSSDANPTADARITNGQSAVAVISGATSPGSTANGSVPARTTHAPPLDAYGTGDGGGTRFMPARAQAQPPDLSTNPVVTNAASAAYVVNGHSQHDASGVCSIMGKELPKDVADLRKENRRLQTQLEDLASREKVAATAENASADGARFASDTVTATLDADYESLASREERLNMREAKLRLWAERLESKQETLMKMEKISMQLRRLQKWDWEARAEATRTANGVRQAAGDCDASWLATTPRSARRISGAAETAAAPAPN